MSEPRIAALVCEGQTDVPILRALIQELWPSVEEVFSLQPELDETDRARGRTGWTAVSAWCKQHATDIDEVIEPLLGDPIDLLLVAVDFDIAHAAGVAKSAKTLGPKDVHRLQSRMRDWLLTGKGAKLPAEVVLSTPVMAIETWVIAAFFPGQRSPEKIMDPVGSLVAMGKLQLSPMNGRPRKELHRYRSFAARIAGNLKRVRKSCPEAERTCAAIERRRFDLEG